MSRPRKPFGPNPPGRLLGTMIKVLAAELSDQGRLSRGKRYWADDAVIDIVVGHGAVTAEVQGSRQQPYVVTIEASSGDGVPGRREVWAQCTCPDDAGTGVDLCKHAVAAFFTLADEVTIEPELVDRWRAARHFGGRNERSGDEAADVADVTELPTSRNEVVANDDDDDDDDDDETGDHHGGAEIIQLHRGRTVREHHEHHEHQDLVADDVISTLLRAPAGAAPPEFPDVSPLDHGTIRHRLVADVLNDALDHLGIRWE